jgi:hypothetical protein
MNVDVVRNGVRQRQFRRPVAALKFDPTTEEARAQEGGTGSDEGVHIGESDARFFLLVGPAHAARELKAVCCVVGAQKGHRALGTTLRQLAFAIASGGSTSTQIVV